MPLSANAPDLSGQLFGKLFVLRRAEKDEKNRAWFWQCVCLCQCVGTLGALIQRYQGSTELHIAESESYRAALLDRIRQYVAETTLPTVRMRTADLKRPLRIRSCGCHWQEMRKQHIWAKSIPQTHKVSGGNRDNE